MTESHPNEDHGNPHGPKTFEIKIDRTTYKVDEPGGRCEVARGMTTTLVLPGLIADEIAAASREPLGSRPINCLA